MLVFRKILRTYKMNDPYSLPHGSNSLHEKCPNTEFFVVRIFLHSDRIQTRKNSVFGHFTQHYPY